MKIKVNETPVRTSRNFIINNLKLENINIPESLKSFENISLEKFDKKGNQKFITNINEYVIEDTKNNTVIESNTSKEPLKYGNGKILEENVFNNANSKIKLETKKEDIKIKYNFDDKNSKLINNIEIVGVEDANIYIEYNSNTDKKCFHNGIIRTTAKENCKLNIIIINKLNNKTQNFEAIENNLYENSKVNYTIIDIGGQTSVTNYYSNIIGKNANNDLKTIYLGQNNEIKDLNYIAELKGEKSNIDIDVQGVLDRKLQKEF